MRWRAYCRFSVGAHDGISAEHGGPSQRLLSFDRTGEQSQVAGAALCEFVWEHTMNGARSLRLDLSEQAPFLALRAGDRPLDLSGWDKMKPEVYRGGPPLAVNLRVRDEKGDRYTA